MFMGGNTDATCFHICGDTQADVKLAKKLIQKLQTIKIEDNTEMLSRKRDDGIPGHWELMPATPCQVFAIQANTSEYDEILKLFQASCNQTVDVTKVALTIWSFNFLFITQITRAECFWWMHG